MAGVIREVIKFGYDGQGRVDFELDPDEAPALKLTADKMAEMMRNMAKQIENRNWVPKNERQD